MAVPMEGAAPRRPGLWGTGAPVWVAALLALAVTGFWKSYLSRVAAVDAITHLHAGLMLSWFAMLFAQPLLVRSRQLAWHRKLGRISYGLVPAIVLTCVLLSRVRMAAVAPQGFGFQCVILYLGLSAALMFLLFWTLAIVHRRDAALHARYMVGTALVMVDPAMARIVGGLAPQLGIGVLWISYRVVFAILGVLVWRGRGRHGRNALVLQLALFAANFMLIHLVPGTAAWQAFARAWGGLPPG